MPAHRSLPQRVALLAVGSFNPPTIMHLRMLEVARDYVEKIHGQQVVEGILSPVADTYGKADLAAAEHRYAMAQLATSTSNWIRADDWECTQKTWTRTLEVLKHHRDELSRKYEEDIRLKLVVGGDVVDSFTRILPDGHHLWNPLDIKAIIAEFGLFVLCREDTRPSDALSELSYLNGLTEDITFLSDEICPCAVSSTRLRSAIKDGRSIRYATPDAVISYIHKHGLYK